MAADIFLSSIDGNDVDDGSTWALAKATLQTGIAAVDVASQRVLIDFNHSETAATINYVSPGTPATPCQILSVTQTGAGGVSALTNGATFTGTGTMTRIDGSVYVQGITLQNTSNSSSGVDAGGPSAPCIQIWKDCTLKHTGLGASSTINLGSFATGSSGKCTLLNPTFSLNNVNQRILYCGDVIIHDGQITGTIFPTGVFGSNAGAGSTRGGKLLVDGFDFSAGPTSISMHSNTTQGGTFSLFRNCKVPESWVGTPLQGSAAAGHRVEAYSTWNSTTKWRIWIVDYSYTLRDETTIVKTGGYQDDVTPVSWKMVTTANCAYPTSIAVSPDILINNTTTGSARTVSFEIVHDSLTDLTDADAWPEVEYLDTNGASTLASGSKSTVIATSTALSKHSSAWTTTGLTNPNKQVISVTFTPQQKGYFICRVCCSVPNKTFYFDPLPMVS